MRPAAIRRIPVGLAAGLRLEVDPRAPVHVYAGTAEAELAPHLRRLARPGTRCCDVGSHNAYYALVLARLTGEPVVTVEFDAAGIERIRRNLSHNPGLAPLIEVRRAYVADVVDPAAGVTTLDHLVLDAGLPSPDLVKIDVEGAEASVLRGASRILDTRPHLVLETHGRAAEQACAELLLARGYAPRVVTQRRWLREHRAPGNRWLVAEGDRPRGSGRGRRGPGRRGPGG
jgi:hypothetical protein